MDVHVQVGVVNFSGDDPLDPFAGASDLPPLELAEPPPPKPSAPPRAPAPEPTSTSGHPPPTSAHPPSTSARPPQKRADASRLRAEAKALSGFGDPPESPLTALPYAINVLLRMKDLRTARGEIAARIEAAKLRANAALIHLGRALLRHQRSDLEDAGLGSLAAVASEASGETESKAQEAQQLQQDAEVERRRLDAEIAAGEKSIAPLRDRETKLRAEVDVLQHELKRRQAALQRVQIELRNSPERSAELQSSLSARQSDVMLQQERTDEKRGEYEEIQRRLADGLEQLKRRQQTRKHLDRELTGSIATANATIGKASTDAEQKLLELGRSARERNLPMRVTEAAAAAKAVQHAEGLERELTLHDLALNAWDRRGMAIGGGILAGFVLLMLVVLVMIVT